MDAHTYYPREYLRTGVNRLRRGDVAWVGGPQLPLGTGGWSSRIAAAMETRLGVGGASFRFVPRTEFVTDAAFTGVLSRELLHELGAWNEPKARTADTEPGLHGRGDSPRPPARAKGELRSTDQRDIAPTQALHA